MRASLWLFLLLCTLPAWSAPDDATRLQQAERLLTQAERDPAHASSLMRQAAELAPADAWPAARESAQRPTPRNLAQARREIVALRQAVVVAPAPAAGSPTDARATLGTVLARPEFQPLQAAPWELRTPPWLRSTGHGLWKAVRAVGRAISAVLRWIGRVFERLFSKVRLPKQPKLGWVSKLGEGTRILLWTLLGVAVLFGLGLLVSRLVAGYRQRETRARVDDLTEHAPNVRRRQEPSFWERSLAQAEALWQQGAEREAVRTLHRACLVLLDARGILRFDDTRANGEVLRELCRQGHAPVCEAFRPIVRTFDRSWYGFLAVNGEEFHQVLDNSRRFREAVAGDS